MNTEILCVHKQLPFVHLGELILFRSLYHRLQQTIHAIDNHIAAIMFLLDVIECPLEGFEVVDEFIRRIIGNC